MVHTINALTRGRSQGLSKTRRLSFHLLQDLAKASESRESHFFSLTMKIAVALVGVFVCFLGAIPLNVGDLTAEQILRIDTFIEALLKCWKVPGMNLAIVKNGKILLTKGYGYADLDTKKPVTDTTLFCIASCTKAFTSTLLAKIFSENSK